MQISIGSAHILLVFVGVWQYPISLCKSAHKASAARWHVGHQATSRQPAIQALP